MVDGEQVGRQPTGKVNYEVFNYGGSFFLGRSTKDMSRLQYAHATFDDLQLWEAKLAYLTDNELIEPGLYCKLIRKGTPVCIAHAKLSLDGTYLSNRVKM